LETFEASGEGLAPLEGFIGDLQHLKTLEVTRAGITELPREIGALQKLQTLRIRNTHIVELPREIGNLQQLKTLDISSTPITVLPKEIGKLQHLEHLVMSRTQVAKIPREIGLLKELNSLKLDSISIAALPLEFCQVVSGAFVEFPECISQALKKSQLLSDLAREMLSFQISGGLVVGAKQMHIPPWIREHFNDLVVLDISICKLEEEGLKILQEMPELRELTLRFLVVPREPIVISSEGFANLFSLTIDSCVPRVTFQEGAMPVLASLTFLFRFYAGPPNTDPMGINHLKNLVRIDFKCNKDWYPGGDSPCIQSTIDIVRKEGKRMFLRVCGRPEVISSPLLSSPPPLEMGQQEEERSNGVGEIEEDIQVKLIKH
jgi:hypothetical protein